MVKKEEDKKTENTIKKIFEALNVKSTIITNSSLKKKEVLFIFGRYDDKLAKKASEIYKKNPKIKILIAGGIGKDSGYLQTLNISESKWIASNLVGNYNISPKDIIIETESTNGGENCRLGLHKLIQEKIVFKNILLLGHTTSIKRLGAVFELEAEKLGLKLHIELISSGYKPNIKNPVDIKESLEEYNRLCVWPSKGWCKDKNTKKDLCEYSIKRLEELK